MTLHHIPLKKDSYAGGFAWRKPKLMPIELEKYCGLSLEEIKNKYGDICAQHVYTMAARHGIDLTQPKVELNDLCYDTFITIDLSIKQHSYGANWMLRAVANGYTQNNDNKIIDQGNYNSWEGLTEDVMPFFAMQQIIHKFGGELL